VQWVQQPLPKPTLIEGEDLRSEMTSSVSDVEGCAAFTKREYFQSHQN